MPLTIAGVLCIMYHTSDHRTCDCMSYELVFDILFRLNKKKTTPKKRENERELEMGIERV